METEDKWYLDKHFNGSSLAKELGISQPLFFKKARNQVQINPRFHQYKFSEIELKKLEEVKNKLVNILLA